MGLITLQRIEKMLIFLITGTVTKIVETQSFVKLQNIIAKIYCYEFISCVSNYQTTTSSLIVLKQLEVVPSH